MNPEIAYRGKVAIEEIVAPIPAMETSKNKLREELWSHLHEQIEADVSLGRDENDALERALTKLGDAKTIRRSYLESLNRVDRFLGWVEHVTERNPKRSRPEIAAIISGIIFLCLAAIIAGLLPVAWRVLGDFHRAIYTCLLYGATMSAWITAWTFGGMLIMYPAQDALRAATTTRQRAGIWLRYQSIWAGVFACISSAVWIVSNAVVSLSHESGDTRVLEFAYMSGLLLAGFTLIQLPLVPYLVVRAEADRRSIPDWPYTMQ